MQPKVRWLVAAGVVLGTFAASAWVSGALVLPVWIRSAPDRRAIKSGLRALWRPCGATGLASDQRTIDVQAAEAFGKAHV